MYEQWQLSLLEESHQNERRKARRERRMKRNERRLLKLQRKLHMQQLKTGVEDLSARRRSSTSMLSDGRSSRQSAGSGATLSSDATTTSPHNESQPELASLEGGCTTNSPERRKTEVVAIRGIFSRLSRTRQASREKELDKMPKLERRSISASVPNLSSLDPKRKDFASMIREGDNESRRSLREDDEDGLFV